MDKLQFTFRMLSAKDEPKTNVLCITSIGTPDGRTYKIPHHCLDACYHEALAKTSAFAKVKKTLTQRGQTRRIWINITTDLAKIYMDEGGNLQFEDVYLEEEIDIRESTNVNINATEQPLIQLLEQLLQKSSEQSAVKNVGKIAKEFTIEKFNGKNSNAGQWIGSFEKECDRFNITEDEKKIEILKSFMDKGAADWYSCTLLKLTLGAEWKDWKHNFCVTFTSKGWSPIRYAMSFKYQTGSLLDYTIKKEKLLLEVRKSIDNGTLIDLIAIGLPNFVTDRIDREKLKITEDLYNEIGKLEHLVSKKSSDTKKNRASSKDTNEKTPCEICKDKGKGRRFHPEAECWFKNEGNKDGKIKHVNNSVLEVELNNNDPKN